MRRFRRFATMVPLFVVIGIGLASYRNWHSADAAQFAPAVNRPVWLPAGTPIDATLRNSIISATEAGDRVTAIVSTPVVLNDWVVIPAGARLKGTIEEILSNGSQANVRMSFTMLFFHGHRFPIQTRSVSTDVPVQSDVKIFSQTLRSLTGATFGLAIGAASGNERMVNLGVTAGAAATIPMEPAIRITLTLTADLKEEADRAPQSQ